MNAQQNQLPNQLNPTMSNNGMSAQIQSVKRMANMLKGKSNPQQMLQMVAQQNPQMSQIMNMVNGSGMSPKQMFMNMAQQQGIDPNSIVNMLK